MNRRTALALSTAALLCFIAFPRGTANVLAAANAQTGDSDAAKAKAMLEKAVAAVKADKAKALDMFNNGESGFYIKDRDIYPFCFNITDGKIVAGLVKPSLGKDIRTFKDSTGKAFGLENYNDAKNAKEGQIFEVSYMFARPGAEQTPVQKVSFITRVEDLGCGVGYYK